MMRELGAAVAPGWGVRPVSRNDEPVSRSCCLWLRCAETRNEADEFRFKLNQCFAEVAGNGALQLFGSQTW